MRIVIAYQELSDIIQAKANHKIDLSFVNADTIKVSKDIKIPFFGTKSVGMDISVTGVEGNDLKLKASSDMISKLIGLVKELNISKYASISGNNIVVHLDRVKQMEKVFDYIELKTIHFTNENLEISTKLRM